MKLPSWLLIACGLLVHLWIAGGEPTSQASDANLLRGADLSGRSLKTPPYARQYDACGDNGKCCYGYGQDGGPLYCLRQKGNRYYAQCNTIQECWRSGAYVCDTNQGACNPAKADRQDRSGQFDDAEEDGSYRDESRRVAYDESISAFSGGRGGGKGSDCKGHNCCASGLSCFRWSNGQRSGNWVNEKFECMTLRECRSSDRFWDCRPLTCKGDEWDAEDAEEEWDAEDGEDGEDEWDAEDEEDSGRDRYDSHGRDEARYVAHDRSRISAFTGGKGHDCKRDFCCSSGFNCYRWSNGQRVGNWVNEKFECMTARECRSAGQGWSCNALQCTRDYRHDSGRRDASRVHSSSGWSYTGQYQACGKNIRTCCSGNGADGGQLYCLRQRSGSGYSQCNTLQECERSRGGYDCNTQQGSCGY